MTLSGAFTKDSIQWTPRADCVQPPSFPRTASSTIICGTGDRVRSVPYSGEHLKIRHWPSHSGLSRNFALSSLTLRFLDRFLFSFFLMVSTNGWKLQDLSLACAVFSRRICTKLYIALPSTTCFYTVAVHYFDGTVLWLQHEHRLV